MALTKSQFEVLSFLNSFIEKSGYCPSFDEIRRGLRLSSLATVHKHLNNLERKSFIQRGTNKSRSIEIIDSRPLVGVKLARGGRRASSARSEAERRSFELPL